MNLNIIDIIDKLHREEERIRKRDKNEIQLLVLHHTLADDNSLDANVFKLDEYFGSKENHITPTEPTPSFCYHTLFEIVDNRSTFYKTAYDEDIVFAVSKWNNLTYNIAINQMSYEQITSHQYDALIEYFTQLCLNFDISPYFIRGHRELKNTGWDSLQGIKTLKKNCPGFINMNVFRKNVWSNLKKSGLIDFDKILGLPEKLINIQYIDKDWVEKYRKYNSILGDENG